MKQTPEQILAAGVAAKERSVTTPINPQLQVSVNEKQQVVIGSAPNLFSDIKDFHEKFGLAYDGPPRELPPEIKQFRDIVEGEEQREIRDAKDANQLAELLDGYVDYIYFVLGRCYLQGWDFNEAWRRVHKANMAKVRAEKPSDGKRGSLFDVVKPPGWTPPDMSDLVKEAK